MKKTKLKSWLLSLSFLLVGFAPLAQGCSEDKDDEQGTTDGDADMDADTDSDADSDMDSDSDSDGDTDEGSTFIRVFHLSPDAPAVDVYANGGLAIEELYYESSTAYLEIPAGTYTFDVSASGTSAEESVLTFSDVTLSEDVYHTAVAFNDLEMIQGLALVDDWSEVDDNMIRVRAIHTAVGVGAVDIWSIPEEGEPAKIYDDVEFGVAGDYLDLPAGAYTLGFDVNEDASPDLIFSLPALEAGTVANVFAVNDEEGVALIAQLHEDVTARVNAGESKIRVIHLSPDAPEVDVFVNDSKAPTVTELGFEESTDFLAVPSAGYNFYVAPSGSSSSDAVLSIEGLILLPGKSYTAVAYDVLENISALAIEDDTMETEEGDIRVRAIHTASGVGEVDIWNVTAGSKPGILWEDVDFADVGQYYDLPSDPYSIGFDVDNDEVPDLTFDIPELVSGTIANVFAVNDGGVYLVAQLLDGTTVAISAN